MMHIEIDPVVSASVGAVLAAGLHADAAPPELDAAVARTLARRAAPLGADDESARLAARDMLRNGRYKPTGRGKPASEYLLRTAQNGAFPRINAPVDVCNVVSLESMLPISVFDLDRAGSDFFVVRHGAPAEAYVFNAGGQTIDLEDLLLCARRSGDDGPGEPIVNPVRDSMATKTNERTTRICAVLYAPRSGFEGRLRAAVERFAGLIAACGPDVRTRTAVGQPGEVLDL